MRYKKLYPAVICFCVFLAAIGLVLGDPSTVLPGLWKIIVTEDALITDYVKIAGVSAALVNSALVTLVSLLLLYLSKEPPNGFTLVELGLMAGFSLFGKNIVNIWPIIAGTFLYAKARREPFGKYVSVSLLATALAPVVSYVALDNGFGNLPVCVAKTQYSFTDQATLLGAPEGFRITVRELKVSAGAHFVVALTGNVLTMPGLPKVPAAENIDVDDNGVISGLF